MHVHYLWTQHRLFQSQSFLEEVWQVHYFHSIIWDTPQVKHFPANNSIRPLYIREDKHQQASTNINKHQHSTNINTTCKLFTAEYQQQQPQQTDHYSATSTNHIQLIRGVEDFDHRTSTNHITLKRKLMICEYFRCQPSCHGTDKVARLLAVLNRTEIRYLHIQRVI